PVLAALGAACLLSAGAAMAQPVNVDCVLVNGAGMTIYTFDKDTAGSGKSSCNGPCAKMWPPVPLTVERIESPYSIVTRDDGSRQLAYKGKPLYLYAKDEKPGDRKGDKLNDVWHVVGGLARD
ncbi:MAG: COG4315 family predicted lipoprotein, partial [Telluria sp.]